MAYAYPTAKNIEMGKSDTTPDFTDPPPSCKAALLSQPVLVPDWEYDRPYWERNEDQEKLLESFSCVECILETMDDFLTKILTIYVFLLFF